MSTRLGEVDGHGKRHLVPPTTYQVFWKEVQCSPCYLRSCPIGHICMKKITVQEVLDSVLHFLKDRRPSPGADGRRVQPDGLAQRPAGLEHQAREEGGGIGGQGEPPAGVSPDGRPAFPARRGAVCHHTRRTSSSA